MTDFACMPPCIECRTAGMCAGPVKIEYKPPAAMTTLDWLPEPPEERQRSYPRNVDVILPCGCYGLPWPLIHTLGENFDEINCDKHGWMKLTKAAKKRMMDTANQRFAEFRNRNQGTLFDDDEPPY